MPQIDLSAMDILSFLLSTFQKWSLVSSLPTNVYIMRIQDNKKSSYVSSWDDKSFTSKGLCVHSSNPLLGQDVNVSPVDIFCALIQFIAREPFSTQWKHQLKSDKSANSDSA